jgi:hypothetical protein
VRVDQAHELEAAVGPGARVLGDRRLVLIATAVTLAPPIGACAGASMTVPIDHLASWSSKLTTFSTVLSRFWFGRSARA